MKNALLALALIIYPVIVYFGLQYVEPSVIAIVFAVIFLIRHFCQKNHGEKSGNKGIPHLNVVLITVLSLLTFTVFANSALALKFYPVVVSLSFLSIFAYSLVKPPSVVEIIARLHENLDEQGIIYTRKVTQIWCAFFSLNALIALWTIFSENEDYWLLYNGLISYILMGALMLGEFLYRKIAKTKHEALKCPSIEGNSIEEDGIRGTT